MEDVEGAVLDRQLDTDGKDLRFIREGSEILRPDRAGIAGEQRREAFLGGWEISGIDPHHEIEIALRQAARNGGRPDMPDLGRWQ